MSDKIKAYKEILDVLTKHKNIIESDHRIDIISQVSDRIKIQEISEEFGISINPAASPDWCTLSEYINIGLFGEEHRSTISWSDDNRQPGNERLLIISFPTGPYIFGRDYYEKTFKAFFDELKSYGPKYSDTRNSNLYFSSDNAKEVNENFKSILDKYKGLVKNEVEEKRIAELEKELKSLRSSS